MLCLLWVGNLIYYQQHQLSEPLFMKHYYDKDWLGDGEILYMDLFYLKNIGDDNPIAYITIPNQNVTIRHQEVNTETFQYQELWHIWLEIYTHSLEETYGTNNLYIDEVEIHYQDGSNQTVNIGEVVFRNVEQDTMRLPTQASGGSSNHTGFMHYVTPEPVIIKGIEIPYSRHLADALTISLNGKEINNELFPLTLAEGERFELNYRLQFPANDPYATNFYVIENRLDMETLEGAKIYAGVHLQYFPTLQHGDILDIIEERGQQ